MSGSPPPSRAATSTWRIELGEELAPRLVLGALLVLDRRPLGMAGHQTPRPPGGSGAWSRVVAGQLGVERGDDDGALAARAPGRPSMRGEHLDVGAGALDDRGADEHGVERRGRRAPATSRSASKRVDLAAVARCGARRRRWRRSSAGRAGRRGPRWRAGSSRRTCRTPACPSASALGDGVEQARTTRAASTSSSTRRRAAPARRRRRAASGVRTSTASAPSVAQDALRARANAPCSASTPTVGASPGGLAARRGRAPALPAPLGELRLELVRSRGRASARRGRG